MKWWTWNNSWPETAARVMAVCKFLIPVYFGLLACNRPSEVASVKPAATPLTITQTSASSSPNSAKTLTEMQPTEDEHTSALTPVVAELVISEPCAVFATLRRTG